MQGGEFPQSGDDGEREFQYTTSARIRADEMDLVCSVLRQVEQDLIEYYKVQYSELGPVTKWSLIIWKSEHKEQ